MDFDNFPMPPSRPSQSRRRFRGLEDTPDYIRYTIPAWPIFLFIICAIGYCFYGAFIEPFMKEDKNVPTASRGNR